MQFPILLDNFVQEFISLYGFRPDGIYCQITGRLIGTTDNTELAYTVAATRCSDLEDVCHDVAIRLLASMRPSMRWNKMRADSLTEMQKSAPVDTFAYLLNRFFAPLQARKLGINSLLATYEDRIKLHGHLTRWMATKSEALDTILYMMLELDAKWGLDTETAPFNCTDFIMADTHETRLALLQPFYDSRMKDWQRKIKRDELQTRWHRSGNALARPAFFTAWMEQKPLTATQIKSAERKAAQEVAINMLNDIMGRPNLAGERKFAPPIIERVELPSGKMPARFGTKKESV